VLAYYPNKGSAAEDEAALVVYSPMLERRSDQGGTSRLRRGKEKDAGLDVATDKDETASVFTLNSEIDPAYPNIEFVLYAAHTIGRLYGHAACDFLDIPAVIEQTGEVNLKAIDRDSRLNTPVHHLHIVDCLAWIFGHMHRERDLDAMRDLASMFRFIISYGMIRRSRIDVHMQPGAENKPLPLVRYEATPG
jgi:hypothetical protein